VGSSSVRTQTGNIAEGRTTSPPPDQRGHPPPQPAGTALGAAAGGRKPIRIEKRGSLLNPFFLGSIAIVIAGTLLAGEGKVTIGTVLLVIGVPSLLVSTVRSLVR
jgi:hypothetical protein